jgi:hypothetical protein
MTASVTAASRVSLSEPLALLPGPDAAASVAVPRCQADHW